MTDMMIFLLSVVGFAALLLAQPRHQRDWLGRKLAPERCRLLRLSGFAMLALAFIVAADRFGGGYGAVVWSGWLTISAGLVVCAQAYRAHTVSQMRR